jgi:O-acetyl-ADP-ribose deacetylase (regulator of RNase III)
METKTVIELAEGNLLRADVEALVNTVNCVGYMGKGIALQFKQAFPENFEFYERACRDGDVQPGKMLVFATQLMISPKFIINFPTKRHWRGNSRIEDIEDGLTALVEEVRNHKIKSIAVPPLGCGNGGLDWNDIKPLIEHAFAPLPQVRVLLFEPKGAPNPAEMPVRTPKPKISPGRAAVIMLLHMYSSLGYRRTLLEIQKLAYFLQEAGEPLRLKYEAGHYGPYAKNLNNVLERIEGHYIRGYGDSQKPDIEIDLLPEAVNEAQDFLSLQPDTLQRLERVSALIEGFETPYGMELLASVHWVAQKATRRALSDSDAIDRVHSWNERKSRLMRPDHIRVAWKRLEKFSWINSHISTDANP